MFLLLKTVECLSLFQGLIVWLFRHLKRIVKQTNKGVLVFNLQYGRRKYNKNPVISHAVVGQKTFQQSAAVTSRTYLEGT
jgi:hypothetical protein